MRKPENINTLLDRVIDHAQHVKLSELKQIDDNRLIDAIRALQQVEKFTTELAFTGKVRKLPE